MKKAGKILLLLMLYFFLNVNSSIPVYAMGDEEKELLSQLGVEYTVDEKGNFESFVVSEDTPRFTYEDKVEFAQKYNGINRVGDWDINIIKDESDRIVSVDIMTRDGEPVFMSASLSTLYCNTNQEFVSFLYEDESAEDAYLYGKGSRIPDENGLNAYEEYERLENGKYVLAYRRGEGKNYTYDENGEVLEYTEYDSGIVYDANGNPIKKMIKVSDGAGEGFVKVPYVVADEIEDILKEDGASYYEYNATYDANIINSKINELLTDAELADKLGMEWEAFQEKNEIYEKLYEEQDGRVPLSTKANIFGVEMKQLWEDPQPVSESDIPGAVSEKGIADEVTKLINDYRVANGLQPLDTSDPVLQQVADIRAEEITYVMNKAHSRPLAGSSGGFGVGENCAMCYLGSDATNQEIAQMLFEAWKKSPLHNENMLCEEYKQGGLGIKIVLQNGVPAVYASNDFSSSTDYQNEVATIVDINKRIQVGAQVPGNIESAEEYYRKYYDLEVPEFANEYTSEESFGLEVLDENGNRFQLPNGVEWEYAWTDFRTYEGIWAPDGNVYTLSDGVINFETSDGHVYSIYAYPEVVDDGYSASSMTFTNNYSGNTIVLKKCAYYTLDMLFPAGYYGNQVTNDCYYILNGETVVISF